MFCIILFLSILVLVSCNEEKSKAGEDEGSSETLPDGDNTLEVDKLNEELMPNGFYGLNFGMDYAGVRDELAKYSIDLTKSVMEGGEILIFIQNTTKDISLINGIINYISSGKFSPNNPTSRVLPEISIYNLNITEDSSYHLMNKDWRPVELYFFQNKFFAMSANVGKSLDGKRTYKEKVINLYNNGVKVDSDEFSTIYEDANTYMNINVADSLYLYDKNSFRQVLAYVKARLKILN